MQAFSRFIRPATGIRRLCSPVLNFNNAEAAYKPKSTWEIARTLVVFQLCAQPWLVCRGVCKADGIFRRLRSKVVARLWPIILGAAEGTLNRVVFFSSSPRLRFIVVSHGNNRYLLSVLAVWGVLR